MGWLLLKQVLATDLLLTKTLLVLVVRIVSAIVNGVFFLWSFPGLIARGAVVHQGNIGLFTLTFIPLDTQVVLMQKIHQGPVNK